MKCMLHPENLSGGMPLLEVCEMGDVPRPPVHDVPQATDGFSGIHRYFTRKEELAFNDDQKSDLPWIYHGFTDVNGFELCLPTATRITCVVSVIG